MTALVPHARERRNAGAFRDAELDSTTPFEDGSFAALVESHRRSLRGHCYGMLKSSDEAEDAVQETLLKAWRARASYAGCATVGSWLHQIATNVCLDELDRRRRRARPHRILDRLVLIEGCPEGQPDAVASGCTQPDAIIVANESLAQACLTVFALLPPRQRAVLILRDVLSWSASETAEMLATSIAGVNSTLQRARATLDTARPASGENRRLRKNLTPDERVRLRRYVDAIGQSDAAAAVAVVRVDVASAIGAAT